MAEQKTDQERTEEPTQRKLEKAREEGNVSVSREISSVMLMIVSMATFIAGGGFIYSRVEGLFETFFYNSDAVLEEQEHAVEYLEMAFWYGFEMMMPVLVIVLFTAVLVNIVQTGAAFSWKAVKPKSSKINPVNGFKRIFSMKGFVELAKGFSKLIIVGLVVYFTVRNDIDHFISFIVAPLEHNLAEAGSYILMFVGRVLAALFILSVADAAYQQFQHKKDLRMTKQEVKDERKNMEGDPQVKSQRKKMGMAFRQRKRLDHAVMNSDVVVTNPIHYAIALKYEPDQNDAPIVMAKGQRLRAKKIRELAHRFNIPVVEDKPVARALFATTEEDRPIPEDLYHAVAEILAYVYKLMNRTKST